MTRGTKPASKKIMFDIQMIKENSNFERPQMAFERFRVKNFRNRVFENLLNFTRKISRPRHYCE